MHRYALAAAFMLVLSTPGACRRVLRGARHGDE